MVLDGFEAADLDSRRPYRGIARHPVPHFSLDGGLEKRAKLVVELLVGAVLPEQAGKAGRGAPEPGHYSSPSEAASMRAMADVCTSHSRVSRWSFARPGGVSE
jgi:hypothetical protein